MGQSVRSQRKQGTGNAQTYRGDPQQKQSMLTQSSFGGGKVVNTVRGGNAHQHQTENLGPSGQGYISDYYLNNNKKRGPYEN